MATTRQSTSTHSTSDDRELVDGLVELTFGVQGTLGEIGARHDLSLTQVRLLGILRDREPGVQELAKHLGLEKSSVSGLVDRAEARGLVRRVPSSDDRRVVRIAITRTGRTLVDQSEREVAEMVGVILKPLSASQRRQLSTLLRLISPAS